MDETLGKHGDNKGKPIKPLLTSYFQLKFKKGDIITITQKEDGGF